MNGFHTYEMNNEPKYKINIMTGIYDAHFTMVNALVDFLNNNNFDWVDKNELFTIKKGIHMDGNIEHFFTFIHKGYSYHAYVEKIYVLFNGRPQEVRIKIYRITSLNVFSVK